LEGNSYDLIHALFLHLPVEAQEKPPNPSMMIAGVMTKILIPHLLNTR
jgi:hypothetical protein